MIRIGICDDEKLCCEEIGSHIADIFEKSNFETEVLEYTSPSALLEEAWLSPFDVLFLDIDMVTMLLILFHF